MKKIKTKEDWENFSGLIHIVEDGKKERLFYKTKHFNGKCILAEIVDDEEKKED